MRMQSERNVISGSDHNVTRAGDEGWQGYLGAVFEIATGDRVNPNESRQDSARIWTYLRAQLMGPPLHCGCNTSLRYQPIWGDCLPRRTST